MKLTKDQRFTAYCIMLEEAENNTWAYLGCGLCHLSEVVCGIFPKTFSVIGGTDVLWENCYPELISKKPKRTNDGFYWFTTDTNGWDKRSRILKQCIAETSNF